MRRSSTRVTQVVLLIITSLVFNLNTPTIAAGEVNDFTQCKITSSRPGWNTVGFPIQQIFGGRSLERLPFDGTIDALIIPVDFLNYRGDPEEISEYTKYFTDETNSFFETVSYGKVRFDFKVLSEYVTLNRRAEDFGIGTWGQGIYENYYKEALNTASLKFDISGYDVAYVIATPRTPGSAITPGPAFNEAVRVGNVVIPKGSATGGMTRGTAPWRWMVHETGHLFGFNDLYDVAAARQGKSGIHEAFGWWDIMSMNWETFALELNAWFRIQSGWLPESDAFCLNGSNQESKQIQLSALNSEEGTRAVVVPLGPERVLVAEYRTMSKYNLFDGDPRYSGLLVYEVDGARESDAAPMVILRKGGMKSNTAPLRDAALQVGEYVERSNVLIGVSAKDEKGISVRVSVGTDKSVIKSQLESDKLIFDNAESEKALAEKLAAEKAEQDRMALEKAMLEKAEAEKAAEEKLQAERLEAERKAAEKSKRTLICVKGKKTRTVVGVKPKCPKGFNRR